jgi:hypothetical protein
MRDADAGGIPNRRITHPQGRRVGDRIALPPELQVEALAYAAEIERCLSELAPAREQDVTTRHTWMQLRMAADALHAVLATGESQRPPVMPHDDRLEVPTWDGQPRPVASVWRLEKGGDYAECHLMTHPLGAEIRVTAAGEHERSEAGRDSLALVDKAKGWKRQFQDKGWH